MPHRAAQGYIARLIDQGHKVAICDQIEDPAKAKGLVKRDVVRVITPGMIIEDELLEEKSFTAEMDLKSVSFLIAGCEGFSNEEKQRFLEITSTRERLEKSVASLEKMIARMKITAEIHRIIGGNGNIKRFGASG